MRSSLVSVVAALTAAALLLDESFGLHTTKTTTTTKAKASLLFQGDVTVRSETLPEDVTRSQLADFLRRPDSLKAFATADEAEGPPQEVPVSSDWESAWKKYCTEWYGPDYLPGKGDCIFSTDTWTKFPGIQLCTTVYTGVKILPSKNNNLPSYCFLVIGQKQTAKGLPPIVWMFHQLMGAKPTDDENGPVDLTPSGPVKSSYTVEENKDDGRLCFRLDTNFQFKIEFPAVLLKILPTSKAKAEKQGSAALSKTISKAGKKGMESGHKCFLGFYSKQQQENNAKVLQL